MYFSYGSCINIFFRIFGIEIINDISQIDVTTGLETHELAEGQYQKIVILPDLSVGDVILYQSSKGGRLSSETYKFASVTSVGEGDRLMKVHDGLDGRPIPEIYVKIEGMDSDKIKSRDDLAEEAGQLTTDIESLRTEIAAKVGFTISKGYLGGTNFVSTIQSYGFGQDLQSQPKTLTTEYRDELRNLKDKIEARNTVVKTAYGIDEKETTKDIYEEVTRLEGLYSGLKKMPMNKYADFPIDDVAGQLATAKATEAAKAAEAAKQAAAEVKEEVEAANGGEEADAAEGEETAAATTAEEAAPVVDAAKRARRMAKQIVEDAETPRSTQSNLEAGMESWGGELDSDLADNLAASAAAARTGSAPVSNRLAQPFRGGTVSTRAHTSSGSVSDALERIKEALIEKKRRSGSDP